MTKSVCWFVAACFLFSSAGAQVMLSPGTLVLDDGQRSGAIVVGVPGSEPASFEVSDAFYVQEANGHLVARDPTTAANSAAGFLRAGPRRFSVTPGQGQQVRVALRPPRDLPPGEYRLHLIVTNSGQQALRPAEVKPEQGSDALALVIPIRVARGVRVLYRHKVKPLGARLESLSVRRDGENLDFEFNVLRLGETSLIGKYQLFARDKAGNAKDIGTEKGLSLYADLDRRRITAREHAVDVPAEAELCVRLIPDDPGNRDLKAVESCAQ